MKRKYFLKLLIICLIFVGCNKKEQISNKSKVVTVSLGAKPKSLDPQMYNEILSLSITDQIYNTLFEINKNGEIGTELAEKYEYKSPTELDITIKKGVKFHNGEELTSDDVVFSLERMLRKPASRVMIEAINSVTKVDKYRIKINLNKPSAPLLYVLSHPLTAILNKKFVESKNDNISIDAMGTGAFEYVEWGNGENIQLIAFKDYFRDNAKIDRLVFRAIPEETSRLAALETGEIDIANIAPIDIQVIDNNSNLYSCSFSTNSTEYLTLNTVKPPFDNLDFRKALQYAIDKQSIIDTIYLGKGTVANSIVNPTIFGANKNLKGYEYNPKKAKELLLKSGIKNRVLKITSNDNTVRLQAAQIIQANLKEIGIETEIEILEWGTYLQMTAQGNYDMFIGGWVAGIPDADMVLYPLLHSSFKGGAGNRAYYDNPKYDKLVELGRSSLSSSKRIDSYFKAQEILQVENPLIPLYYKNQIIGLNKRIQNFIPVPNTIYDYSKIYIK